jgi:Ca2+-binding RTX toxin-like protein
MRRVFLVGVITVLLGAAHAPPASAGTLALRSVQPHEEFALPYPVVTYRAAPGEINHVVGGGDNATLFTLADTGAVVTAGAGCTSVDAHHAECRPIPADASIIPPGPLNADLGDGDDTATGATEADGGPGNDTLADTQFPSGGPGDDVLVGTENGGDDLEGGPGRDTLSGLAGDDTLAGGPGDDTLDGGPGTDTASYLDATAAVHVDLRTSGDVGGRPGEHDRVTSVEGLRGGPRDDVLIGNGSANVLRASGGHDRLEGGGGPDHLRGTDGEGPAAAADLVGGPGADTLSPRLSRDRVSCGAGRDRVDAFPRAARPRYPLTACERITVPGDLNEAEVTLAGLHAGPRVARVVVTGGGRGRIELRGPGHGAKRYGSARWRVSCRRLHPTTRRLRIRLSPAGRAAVRRHRVILVQAHIDAGDCHGVGAVTGAPLDWLARL